MIDVVYSLRVNQETTNVTNGSFFSRERDRAWLLWFLLYVIIFTVSWLAPDARLSADHFDPYLQFC